MDLRGVASRCALEAVDALRSLDRLTATGIAERVAATRARSIRWGVTCDRIVIAFEPHEDSVAVDLLDRVERSRSDAVSDAIARFGVRTPDRGRTRRLNASSTVRLEPDDLPELVRRIQSVRDYLDVIGKRSSGGLRGLPNYSNHAIRIDVEPLAGPVLPQPAIQVVPRAAVAQHAATAGPGSNGHALSPRERDVADAMARGMTRPQIASLLGVSVNTVGTLSLRIYRKLGVRTRLELAHRLHALPAPPADAPTGAGRRKLA